MMLMSSLGYGQRQVGMNNPNYDDRLLSYGFLIGLHTSSFQLKYSDEFLNLDTLHSIQPNYSPGFSLGFIVNFRVADFLDVRLLPKVSFYEHDIDYRYTDGTIQKQLIESTVVEFPLLLKYTSVRRGNLKMYLVGGVKPGIEASAKNAAENEEDVISIQKANLSLDFGVGFDLYYPLFKFSPELRFSRGIRNMLGDGSNDFSTGIESLNTNTVTLYLLFQ
jgi:hypothetical protein